MFNRKAGRWMYLTRSGESLTTKNSCQLVKVGTAIFFVYNSVLQQSAPQRIQSLNDDPYARIENSGHIPLTWEDTAGISFLSFSVKKALGHGIIYNKRQVRHFPTVQPRHLSLRVNIPVSTVVIQECQRWSGLCRQAGDPDGVRFFPDGNNSIKFHISVVFVQHFAAAQIPAAQHISIAVQYLDPVGGGIGVAQGIEHLTADVVEAAAGGCLLYTSRCV